MSFKAARNLLAFLWFAGSFLFLAPLVLGTALGTYGANGAEVAKWALSAITPTLGVVIGGLLSNVGEDGKRAPLATVFLSSVLSIAYLGVLVVVPLVEYLHRSRADSDGGIYELIKLWGAWVPPFQGLVAPAVAFFFRKEA